MDKSWFDLAATQGFLPHGVCFQWDSALLTTMVAGNAFIALAYYSIPVALLVFARRRADLHFKWIFVLFSAFVFMCGTTHVIDIVTIWSPQYRLEAVFKAATAIISVVTAVLLWPLIPRALRLPSTAQLEALVRRLEGEVQERRAAEAELDRLNRELEARVAERTRALELETAERERLQALEHEREALEAASRSKSEFLSRVSHELRTPLNGVLGFGQLLKSQADELSPQHRQWVDHVERSGWHLLRLIDDVLDISRLDAGRMTLEPENVDVPKLLHDCELELKANALAHDITITTTVEPAARTWRGDLRRLRQICTNLLSNAIKYNRPQGEVRIETELCEDGRLCIAIRDTGIGIDERQRAQLFQPFNRLGRERSAIPGTGLGLVVVKQLVEAMGGSIAVESQPDRGTCVRLALPFAPA
ncbi:MAG TPA: ATP-binding protein [Methylibium sp.]|uniref:sensor histidine kinase n=1 Tax=Methylibium sp. TaxID=2067992 RepID=UPI002DBE41ED|nr:ATP-binding protein [Methylibium sp.]HEU4459554.1 ATP-binding protein [Methylibium sp.]